MIALKCLTALGWDLTPPQPRSPSNSPASSPGGCNHLRPLNMEDVLDASGRIFSVPLGDSGPQIETDPFLKGRHQIPKWGNWPPFAKAEGSARKRLWGWVSRN